MKYKKNICCEIITLALPKSFSEHPKLVAPRKKTKWKLLHQNSCVLICTDIDTGYHNLYAGKNNIDLVKFQ